MKMRPYRAQFLVQWNARQSQDNPSELVDKVVEAVMHQQGIQFVHTNEYRSVYSYDKLIEQLKHYDRNYYVHSENSELKYGLSQAFRCFACPDAKMKLSPITLMNASSLLMLELAIKGDKSAGLTSYGETKLEAFTTGLDKAVDILCHEKSPAPCLAGIRTQRKGKTRLIWMYPLEMTIIEATVARPLINYFKGIEHVMSFGDYSLETGLRFRKACSECKYYYAWDLSQFDSTIGPLFIHYAFNMIRTWYNLEDKIYEDVTVGDVIQKIEDYFITTPIVMPEKDKRFPTMVTGKRGGVPSGSYFTQLVDSFVNVALTYAVSSHFGLNLTDDHINVLGDDNTFFCNDSRGEKLLDAITAYLSTFGFKLNRTKCQCGLTTEKVPYLGRDWRNGFPIRPMSHLVRSALYPEKWRRYDKENGANREKQALNVIGSFLLTSYIEDPNCELDKFSHVYHITPEMTSGFTEFLLKEGLMPGDVHERAIY